MRKKSKSLVLFILNIFILGSCLKEDKCIETFELDFVICQPIDLERKEIKLKFIQYSGFEISIDTFFLKKGQILQNINFNDISSEDEIRSFKKVNIDSIIYVGNKTLNIKELYSFYGWKLKEINRIDEFDRYKIFKNNKLIGYFRYDKKSKRFIIRFINNKI